MTSNQNLILTTSFSYGEQLLIPFLKSLDEWFNGTLVIFSDTEYNLSVFKYRIEILVLNKEDIQQSVPCKLENPINFRHFLYLEYLKGKQSANMVMLCDMRDVIFQHDPFIIHPFDKIHVAVEDAKIMDCQYNQEWNFKIFGGHYLSLILNDEIICAGTTWGLYPKIISYLDYMTSELVKYEKVKIGDEIIADQALHNRWCKENSDYIYKHINSSGSVFTMGHSKIIHFNRNGELINELGQPYAVVHQYDRFPWMNNMIESKYFPVSPHISLVEKLRHWCKKKLFN